MPPAQYQRTPDGDRAKQSVNNTSNTSVTSRNGGRTIEANASMDNQKPQNSSESDPQGTPEKSKKDKEPPRDKLTGRVLSDDGGSCLRCIEKGLKCTLYFFGVEGEDKCAACKRSGAQYCIRQFHPNKRLPFWGPPWKSPNYFTIGDDIPSRAEMEDLIREHYQGQQRYSHGTYQYEGDLERMALPPFNGSDLPVPERPENWKTMDWTRVLPVLTNASLHPRPANLRIYGEPITTLSPREQAELRQLQLTHIDRGYVPRRAHLREEIEDLEETW
ncbi:hypothetical protein AAE478_002959 [Parahypoxylon ruwenzoriense]